MSSHSNFFQMVSNTFLRQNSLRLKDKNSGILVNISGWTLRLPLVKGVRSGGEYHCQEEQKKALRRATESSGRWQEKRWEKLKKRSKTSDVSVIAEEA